MSHSTQETLRFPPVEGLTVRAEFDGGALSSDFGPLVLRGVDRQLGLTAQLADAMEDRRHPAYITHPIRALFAQRVYQMGCAYEDGNDANTLRRDPLFKLGLDRKPLGPDQDLASAPTLCRLENAVTRTDLYRMGEVFVAQFIGRYATPPESIVLDLDHSEDPTHGQQELAFYHGYYEHHCYLPLFIFEGLSGQLVLAALRPGQSPTGADNAAILRRVLKRLRAAWPETHILLRGDSAFASPELMALALDDPHLDVLFGLTGNRALSPLARPHLDATRHLHAQRSALARHHHQTPPEATRTYHDIAYAAKSWPAPFRVVLKAEVMALGENPRFVVTSLTRPEPEDLYRGIYAARGQDENFIKTLKNDLGSDRTSAHGFLANQLRLFFAGAAYVLHQALRTEVLVHTELACAQPATVILKLFKIAVRVEQYKDRIKLHLPSHCPVKAVLHRITEILFQIDRPAWNTG
jgi:hypothetical protein